LTHDSPCHNTSHNATMKNSRHKHGPLAQLAEQLTLNREFPIHKPTENEALLAKFLESRRQGISPQSIRFYRQCLSPLLSNYSLTTHGINNFLGDLKCGNAKHSYYRAIRALCNWAVKIGYLKDNPIVKIDAPAIKKPILPSLTTEQVDYLIEQADCLRDRAMISLFAESGMRLSELTNIKATHINWEEHTIIIWGKGAKQRKAVFTERTATLLREYIAQNGTGSNIWHLSLWGIVSVLRRLERKTGLPCNPHTFRRTFASNLHRSGLDVEHIMRLGGWESLDMVLRYTRSVRFEDSLKLYRRIND
jgi:site-specific recombinase XerD